MSDSDDKTSALEMRLATIEALLLRIAQNFEPKPEGLAPPEAAVLVGVSVSKLHAMNDDGRIPSPIKFGDRLPRWSWGELVAWMQSGAPPRARWEAMREMRMRNAS